MTKHIFSSLFLLISFLGKSQENIPVESWRMHISYNTILAIDEGDNKIFAAAKNGVFYFDKEDNSINTITKMDGLSDVSISTLAYSKKHKLLLIGYESGNLDVWENGNITNINTVLQASLSTSKQINDFTVFEDYCYISTNFGMLRLDLKSLVIEESYQNLGENGDVIEINSSIILRDSIYLATKKGVISATLDTQVNILDFNNWKRYNFSNKPFSSIASFKNKIYAAEESGNVYTNNNGNWEISSFSFMGKHVSISATESVLLLSSKEAITVFDSNTSSTLTTGIHTVANQTISDENGNIWIADSKKGVVTNYNGNYRPIRPEGPFSDKTSSTYYHDNKVFVLPGGRGDGGIPLNNDEGFYVFESGFWKNYNNSEVAINLMDVVFNPVDEHYYFASYASGLLKFDGISSFEIINQNNSTLEPWPFNSNYIIVSGVAANQSGLWVANYGFTNRLHWLNSVEIWNAISQTGSSTPMDIVIAENGDKWIKLDTEQGGKILVFNESTGKNRILQAKLGNGGLPTNIVNDIAIDKDGLVWVATTRGVGYFTSTYAVENNNNVDAILPIYDGYAILREEVINCIAIDGGNRKWFGTQNGVWLFDANLQNEVYYFNTENSPLTSNNILDISIHEKTGEVFIATDNGLVSFRSPATEGAPQHGQVKVFPNPVPPEFEGTVAISGLAKDAIVKITDISGKLIRQMRSNGGTAGWDVRDYNGNKAATGVYFVFSATDDGEDTFLVKIAIVK